MDDGSNKTAIIRQDGSAGGAISTTIYDRVDPMEFVDKMGLVFSRTQAGGAQNENDGKLLALACLCRRMDVFELTREYHLMAGKLVPKSDVLLARVHRAGWKSRWVKDGTDCQSATLELTSPAPGNAKSTYTFSIETAKTAGYIRSGSHWTKRPDQMLRARCITDLVRMVCPEVLGGDVSYEEMLDVPVVTVEQSQAQAQTQAPQRTPEQVAARQRELQAMATGGSGGATVATTATVTTQATTTATRNTPNTATAANTAKPGPQPDAVIDAEVEPVKKTEAAPFDTTTQQTPTQPPANTTATTAATLPANKAQAALMELELTIGKIGLTTAAVLENINKRRAAAGESSLAGLGELPEDKLHAVLTNLQGVLAKKQQAAMQAATA